MSHLLGLQSNHLKGDAYVVINGVNIAMSQILNMQIYWSIYSFPITGTLTWMDHTDMVEKMKLRGGESVAFVMTDYDDKPFVQTFQIIDVRTTRSKNNAPIATIKLMDIESVSAMNLYPEKSWKSATMKEIIDDPDTMKPILTSKKKDFGDVSFKHEDFVVPMNINFLTVTDWLVQHNNYLFFQNRESYVIQDWKELFQRPTKSSSPEDRYRYKTPNEAYRRKITEYKYHWGDMLSAETLQPTGNVASFDITNKHRKYTIESYQGAVEKLKSSGSTPHSFGSAGPKHFYKVDNTIEKAVEWQWSKNANKDLEIEILVPGQFKTQIGDMVWMEMAPWARDADKEFNVYERWLVSGIVDTLTPPDFIQKLTLVRAKFFS